MRKCVCVVISVCWVPRLGRRPATGHVRGTAPRKWGVCGCLLCIALTLDLQVPEDTRVASINHARMENYKKDQTVYRIGDEPQKFYMILTGSVEVWSHPPHEPRRRTVLAQLKRGQSFGEKDILNNDLRTECVTPTRCVTPTWRQREGRSPPPEHRHCRFAHRPGPLSPHVRASQQLHLPGAGRHAVQGRLQRPL